MDGGYAAYDATGTGAARPRPAGSCCGIRAAAGHWAGGATGEVGHAEGGGGA